VAGWLMAAPDLTIQVKVAWWLMPYVNTCIFFAVLFGCEVDIAKMQRTILRAFTFKFVAK
jgi:hypothetical protein